MRLPDWKTLLVLALAGLAAPGGPDSGRARAADLERAVPLGSEVEGELLAGDVHGYLVPLAAGTELRLRLEAHADESPGKDGDDDAPAGALPEAVLLDPSGAQTASVPANGPEVRAAAAQAGTWRVEVRAGTFAGEYELRVEGESSYVEPHEEHHQVVRVTGAPQTVRFDLLPNSWVEIDVRRRSGAAPRVEGIEDDLGRPLAVAVRRATASRVRLEPVPLGARGGLAVTVAAQGGGQGTYEVRARARGVEDRPGGGDDREARRVVVMLAPGADPAQIAAQLGFTLVEVHDGVAVLETPEDREGLEDDDADLVAAQPGVVGAEPDAFARLPEGTQSNPIVVGSDLGRSSFDGQPALDAVRAAAAHALATGRGVRVAILDGGVDASHPALAASVDPGRDFVDGDDDASEARNLLDDDGDGLVDEGYGHGTFLAGLVLAAAPEARIVPVRVLDTDGRGSVSAIAAGIEWAADGRADVLNMSFGMAGGSATLATAVRYALARGVSVVAATGNGGLRGAIDFPASVPGVVAVSAVDAALARPAFANAGPGTAVAAPGTDVVGPYPGGAWARGSGTSFAAALASGGAALALDTRPALSPAGLRRQFVLRARPWPAATPPADRRMLGAGRLDLARLAR